MNLDPNLDSSLALRKSDHIGLAKSSQMLGEKPDDRFYYEPINAFHPQEQNLVANRFTFLEKNMNFPWWFSSMTGGVDQAKNININMARAVGEFGLGMGLGSMRPLLESSKCWDQYDLRQYLGNQPFWGNLGIAQVDHLLKKSNINLIEDLCHQLRLDGIIIHLNLLQEYFQAGGDMIDRPLIEILDDFLSQTKLKVIVKEVGQGMGPMTLSQLMSRPLAAIEMGAYGGTNFSFLENVRNDLQQQPGLAFVGHTLSEMIGFVKNIINDQKDIQCRQFILSGGVKDMMDGYFYTSQLPGMSVFGQAYIVLRMAKNDYQLFQNWVKQQISYFMMIQKCLVAKKIGQ